MRIGVVACGYADGYPRHAPTGTPILVGGRRTLTLGRVSMDMLACDLTHLEAAGVGSPVTLGGRRLAAYQAHDPEPRAVAEMERIITVGMVAPAPLPAVPAADVRATTTDTRRRARRFVR